MITFKQASRLIDISAVRTHNSFEDVAGLVAYGEKYRFINLHVLPCWVSTLSTMLKELDDVFVGAPVGFPGGAHKTQVKLLEAEQLLADGVDEMDIVMNVGKFRSKEYDYVLDELSAIISLANGKALTKVIIEINALTDDEMMKACEIVKLSGADYVKTGTGWIPGDANVERIRKIKKQFGKDLKVKAAGGIRTLEDFMSLYEIGVERMGINTKSAIEIVEALAKR